MPPGCGGSKSNTAVKTAKPPSKRFRSKGKNPNWSSKDEEYNKNAKSGTYKSEGKEWLQIRIDIDKPAPRWPVLDMVSGDFHGADGTISFESVSLRTNVDDDENKYEAVLHLLNVRGGGRATLQLSPGGLAGWKCDVSLKLRKEKPRQFTCERISKFFRKITVDIDYATKDLILPSYDTNAIPNECPGSLADQKFGIENVYGDIGIEVVINKNNSSKIDDPDPSNPWSLSEIYEVMQTERDVDPSTWNMWVLLAGTYRSKSNAGFMFDKKERKGCVLFMDHPWFQGIEKGDPVAMRKYLHTLVHEMGHTFNLPHTFEDSRPDSASFMNYDWRYNERNGPGSYFSNFYFTFDTKEIQHLRHGLSDWVEPGKSAWGATQSDKVGMPPPDEDDISTKKLKLDLFPVKDSYKQTEIVSVEIRLKNIYRRPIYVDTALGLDSPNIRICITKPNGNVVLADPIKYRFKAARSEMLYTAGSNEGPDRRAKIINLFFGADGFYFSEPGTYNLRASYTSGEYYVTSEDVEITVEELGDEEVVKQYLTDENGLYVTLGGSNSPRFGKCRELIEKLHQDDKHKEWVESAYVATASKKTTAARDNIKRAGKTIQITADSKDEEFIQKTQSRIDRFKQGLKRRGEAVQYRALAFSRSRILLSTDREEQAKKEMGEMFDVMMTSKVKETMIEYYKKKWVKMVEADKEKDEEAMKAVYEAYQVRANEILSWQPEDPDEEDNEIESSGLRHDSQMSPFNPSHLELSAGTINLIMGKADETDDVVSVMEYTDSLQKSMQVNSSVVQYAFEIVITHHPLMRKNKIRVPEDTEPSTYDTSTFATEPPTGEDQMNYFRNDSEFCYHHRHWHNVYRANGIPGRNSSSVHLDRQGELFWYMHQQMLARYDAERESWGLDPVAPYQFSETESDGCDLGDEFHTHPDNRRVVPRPPGQIWRQSSQQDFANWKRALEQAAENGLLLGDAGLRRSFHEMTEGQMNWFGHAVEATTRAFSSRYGSFHNSGHGIFGGIGQRSSLRSYMNTTANAVRDPIFYRWHKHVDEIMYKVGNRIRNILDIDAPPVSIGEGDIIITTSPNPPDGFSDFNQKIDSNEINTTLDKPKLRFEHGKLSHDEFYYHIRLRRTADTSRDLALSLRIFICPENRVNEERKWIEMDKFRYIMKGAEAVVSRKDKHSSVIRRFPNEARDDIEDGVARTVSGFCECGWPYHMLLPRGTPQGQRFRLCVVATDNNLDTNNPVRTGCGSLSYCGARDTRYPDRRTMGYPFSLPMFIGSQRKSPIEAMREMANFGYSTFTIKNRDLRLGDPDLPPTPVEPEPIRWICWRESYQISQGGWRDSSWTGRFRILINGSDIRGSNEDNNRPQARLVFNGRRGSGSYRIRDVTLAERDRSSRLNIVNNDESKPINVTFNGEPQVEVGRRREVRSETFDAEVVPGRDYFITFTLSDPGLYYRGSNAPRDYAWRIPNPSGEAETGLNWDDQDIRRQISHDRPYIYGLDRILIN